MAIVDGLRANATNTNARLMSRTTDTSTVGEVDLENANAGSGPTVENVQREINSLNAFTGRPAASAHDADPAWASNELGATTDSLKERVEAIDAEFDPTTGHTHSGAAGDGAQISALNLGDFNEFFGEVRKLTYTDLTDVTGTTFDFSDLFNDASKVPTGSSTTEGVYAVGTVSENVVRIRYKDRPVTDAGGFEIYGRFDVTGSGPYTWNIDFFINNPDNIGEEAADIGTLEADQFGVDLYFMEIFNSGTRPTVPLELTSLIPFGGTGSGGGGSSFSGLYVDQGTSTPVETFGSFGRKFEFDADADQDIAIMCVVPDSYAAGSQIFMTFMWHANAVSGGVKWTSSVGLYRPGTSTTSVPEDSDTYTTTITLATSSDLIRSTSMEITDAAGLVDLTDVQPGDLLYIALTRNATDVADTATVAAKVLASTFKIGV